MDGLTYATAKAYARTDGLTISGAVNRLLRRDLSPASPTPRTNRRGFPISPGRRVVTSEDVARAEAEDDSRP